MSLTQVIGFKGGIQAERLMPGDILATGESLINGALATVGAGVWTGAEIASGIIYRTGSTAGYTDTTDSAVNILNALGGNNPAAPTVPGTSFRLTFINSVAFAHTFAAGSGVVAGVGVMNAAASTWREYLVTVLANGPQSILTCSTTNTSPTVTFVLPPGQVSLPSQGPGSITILPGMTVSGTGITGGTTVLGITQGIGGTIGVTLSANATATNAAVQLTFGPTIKFDGLRSGTL